MSEVEIQHKRIDELTSIVIPKGKGNEAIGLSVYCDIANKIVTIVLSKGTFNGKYSPNSILFNESMIVHHGKGFDVFESTLRRELDRHINDNIVSRTIFFSIISSVKDCLKRIH